MRSAPRIILVAGMLAAAGSTLVHADAPKPAQAGIDVSGSHGFDFLVGEWRVHHRRIDRASGKWVEFDGTCSARSMLEGSGNLEEHWLNAPSGAYRAVGLHSYDRKSGKWSSWWLDGRYPAGPLDPPVQGIFEDGVLATHFETEENGRKFVDRMQWSAITATSFRWEQARSADDGKTWDTSWIMEFTRVQR
jgi:hypothetical protein